MDKKERKTNPEKMALIERSVLARDYIQSQIDSATNEQELLEAELLTVNVVLMMWIEKDTGQTEFKTFRGWIDAGFKVMAKEKSVRIWGMKRKTSKKIEAQNISTGKTETIEQSYRFWPMACLFSREQVEALEVAQ